MSKKVENAVIDLSNEENTEGNAELSLSETESGEYLELHNKVLEAKLALANNVLIKEQIIMSVNQLSQMVIDKLENFAKERGLDPSSHLFDANTLQFKKR